MIFDGHGDIWTDVTVKREAGMKDVFKSFHLERYKKGGVNGGIFVIWIDPPNDKNPGKRALEIIKNMSVEILDNKDIFHIVRKYEDIETAIIDNKYIVVIGLEGLSFIGKDVDLINSLYMFGARHASLTWNEENDLATGVKGDLNRGLTSYGREAIKRLEKLNMIVDVSHANDKTFWEIHNMATKPIIASHSNCRALCKNPRNLTDDQLKAIKESNGIVGLNAFSDFVHDDKDKRDVEHLANHLDHMIKIMGIDHVGFGFDFNDYLAGDTLGAFAQGGSAEVTGIENITKVPNLMMILEKRGFSKEEIEKIAYKNFLRILKNLK